MAAGFSDREQDVTAAHRLDRVRSSWGSSSSFLHLPKLTPHHIVTMMSFPSASRSQPSDPLLGPESDRPRTGVTRRDFLGRAGLGLMVFTIGSRQLLLTPAQARAQGVDLQVLSPEEADLLETWCDLLVPGAREAGVSNFVDAQLAKDPSEALVMIRLLDWPPPFAEFYRGSLAALDAYSRRAGGGPLASLSKEQTGSVVGAIASGTAAPWKGPPAALFYYASRSDGLDVVYGTDEGSQKLDVLRAHQITPPSPW